MRRGRIPSHCPDAGVVVPGASDQPQLMSSCRVHTGTLRRRFAAALLPRLGLFGNSIPGHTTRAPPAGFELATDGLQFCVIANLDQTSLYFGVARVQGTTAAGSRYGVEHAVKRNYDS